MAEERSWHFTKQTNLLKYISGDLCRSVCVWVAWRPHSRGSFYSRCRIHPHPHRALLDKLWVSVRRYAILSKYLFIYWLSGGMTAHLKAPLKRCHFFLWTEFIAVRDEDCLSQQNSKHICADSIQDRLHENHKAAKRLQRGKADELCMEKKKNKESGMKTSRGGNRLDAVPYRENIQVVGLLWLHTRLPFKAVFRNISVPSRCCIHTKADYKNGKL